MDGLASMVAQRAREMAEQQEQWPEAESELDELTQAFLEARYSPQPIEKSAVTRIKEEWKRIRERLRSTARRP